jgi:glycine oxidase
MEHVAYDASTTATAGQTLRATADAICPALAGAPTERQWAGLRPMTPDGLPIIGPDPDHPALLYAVGHSRNGILLAPLTGDCVVALATDSPTPVELRSFSIDRFANFHK